MRLAHTRASARTQTHTHTHRTHTHAHAEQLDLGAWLSPNESAGRPAALWEFYGLQAYRRWRETVCSLLWRGNIYTPPSPTWLAAQLHTFTHKLHPLQYRHVCIERSHLLTLTLKHHNLSYTPMPTQAHSDIAAVCLPARILMFRCTVFRTAKA